MGQRTADVSKEHIHERHEGAVICHEDLCVHKLYGLRGTQTRIDRNTREGMSHKYICLDRM